MAAFLQAPLDEFFFVKSPPGYDSVNPETEEESVWELSKSIFWLETKFGMLLVCYG